MRSANLFGPLKGHCPYKALIGLTQASGLAGGFDYPSQLKSRPASRAAWARTPSRAGPRPTSSPMPSTPPRTAAATSCGIRMGGAFSRSCKPPSCWASPAYPCGGWELSPRVMGGTGTACLPESEAEKKAISRGRWPSFCYGKENPRLCRGS